MTRHYLDHASTSPLRPEAAAAMGDWLTSGPWGDPGRIHAEGMAARASLEDARDQLAGLVEARNREVVFTSGATEALATAVHGAAPRGTHLVVGAVEHSAVRLAAATLVDAGTHEVSVVGVDHHGHVDPAEVAAALRPDTALVALQWANHEVGTRQPVAAVAAATADHPALLLVDAAQAVGRDAITFAGSGIDLLAISGHKLGGPPGTGALVVRRGLRLDPLLVGDDRERARRAGMENVVGLVGLGAAAAALSEPGRLEAEAEEQRRLSGRIVEVLERIEGVGAVGDPDDRLPHLTCWVVEGVEPQAVLLGLDRSGVAAHSGSACASEELAPSPVLEAMGIDAHHSLRLSVGWSTTDADVDALAAALAPTIADLRALAR